ncbi:sugar transporter (plasmid) [Roseovarius faecimaris]|uniref:Sugar transporter n=2 Tax=Roseovarius faecimaris TaxID=2494550 RepID=A0A6I6IMT6_9RHOB|nr:sugar transporter [Roseovarius faecimaris]
MLMLSFVLCVGLPTALSTFYLYVIADDQYASTVGFSVRKEEISSGIEILGNITELSGSSSSDTDILYEFIRSHQLVRIVNEQLDLARIYTNKSDPVFSLGDDTRIEALVDHWNRMVKVFYDSSSGLIEVRVLAFDPQDAQDVAQALFEESSLMINELSAIAREDAMSYAEEDLGRAVDKLKVARQAKLEFQNRTQIVDPQADIQTRMGLLDSLNRQLAETRIDLQTLRVQGIPENDRRVQDAINRIETINELIEQERASFGGGPSRTDQEAYSDLLAEYEALQVEVEFAQQSYLSAQAARDAAFAEAQRQSRYLATHIEPTLAETAEYPKRFQLLAMLTGLAFVFWSILALIYYSLRDRR